MRPVGSAAELERRRRRAVQLWKEGEAPTDISRFLGCSRTSVYRWLEAERQGPHGLDAVPHPGPLPQLSDQNLATLETELRKGATAHGWKSELWTGKRVAILIRRLFDVRYTADHALRIVKNRLQWSCQKPERRARERDEAEIDRWKREEFPRIKKRCA